MPGKGILFPLFVVVPLSLLMTMGYPTQFPQQARLTVPQLLFFVALYVFTVIGLAVLRWIHFYNILLQYPMARRLIALYVTDFIWIVYESQKGLAFYIGKYSMVSVLFCLTMILTAYCVACILKENQ